MPLLPGDSMLFAIGVIAATTGKLSMTIIIPLLIVAALLGDNLNYFVGHKFGELIKEKKKILFLKKEYITKLKASLKKMVEKRLSWLVLYLLFEQLLPL
jgi:membrane-associated protein